MTAAWTGPPSDILGHPAPIQQFVARTDRAVVALQQVVAFPAGCTFTLHLAVRRGSLERPAWARLCRTDTGEDPFGAPSDDDLKFGVRFPDGSRATTVNHAFPGWTHRTDRPDPPMLIEVGGGSSSDDRDYRGDQELWLWPLPPHHPFEFVLEWPAVGIARTAVTVDGGAIARAAGRAEPYWPGRTGRAG